jgi:hypothetical protein
MKAACPTESFSAAGIMRAFRKMGQLGLRFFTPQGSTNCSFQRILRLSADVTCGGDMRCWATASVDVVLHLLEYILHCKPEIVLGQLAAAGRWRLTRKAVLRCSTP